MTPTPTAEPLAAPKKTATLKSRILRAGSWTMFGQLASYALRLASSLFMTRLLVPDMFGVIALAAVLQAIISLLSDIGLRQAIIRSANGDSPDMLNTAWTLQVIRGWFIWAVCALLALGLWIAGSGGWLPPGSVYAAASLPPVIAVSGLSAALMGFQSTKAITVNRDLDLKRFTWIELVSQIVGLVVMAGLGWWTRSIWSIVFGGIVTNLVSVTLSHLWLHGIANRFRWHRPSLGELMGYGRWVLLSSLFFVVAQSADRLLLGAWVDAKVLGLYSLALNLAMLIEGIGTRLHSSVAMPALSEVARERPAQFRNTYFRMRLPFDIAFVGSAGALFGGGQLLVDAMYDGRYAGAGHMLQLLSFSLLFSRFGLAGVAYLSLGEPRNLMWINMVKLASIFIGVPLLYAAFGLDGALWGIALHLAATLPLIHAFNRKHGLNDLRFEAKTLAVWPVGWAIGAAATWVAHRWWPGL